MAIPAAIMTLPITMISKVSPNDVNREPIMAIDRNTVQDILGPNLSANRPLGICIAVYVQKYTLLRTPMVPPTSSTMSEPTTPTVIL